MGLTVSKKVVNKIAIDQVYFQHIKEKLCLDDENIQQIYEYFRLFDRFDRAYIDLDDFIAQFRVQICSFIELPFAQRLFQCMPKRSESKLFFEEFLEGISAFCLLNNESLLRFIFDFIDSDGDEKISREDIIRLIKYTDPLSGKETFFTNFSVDVEQFQMKSQSEIHMQFDHFRLNSDKLLFLIWPAFSLQEHIRNRLLGQPFWYSLYTKVEKKEIQIKNNEKKEQRIKQKLQILKTIKTRNVEELLFKPKVNERKRGQVSDDSKILRRNLKGKRRSTVYIKQQFQIRQSQAIEISS